MSNITFTIYALIPTLATQILTHLDVEGTTEELSTLALSSSSSSSVGAGKPARTHEGMGYSLPTSASEMTSQTSSTTLESDFAGAGGAREDRRDEAVGKRGIGESWASEFVNAAGEGSGEREQENVRPGFPTDVSESSEDYREGRGHAYQHEHGAHHHHQTHDDINEPHVHPFSTPASHSYALQSDIETSTDMSTSISNMTDPSLRSSSSEHDDQEESTTTGAGRPRSRSTGRDGHHGHDRDKGGDDPLLSSPESRYLRSPSRSPRRSRSSGLPREQEGLTSDQQGGETRETSEQAGFSYADIVKVGSNSEQPAGEARGETGQAVKGTGGQGPSGRTKAQLWNEIKLHCELQSFCWYCLV